MSESGEDDSQEGEEEQACRRLVLEGDENAEGRTIVLVPRNVELHARAAEGFLKTRIRSDEWEGADAWESRTLSWRRTGT